MYHNFSFMPKTLSFDETIFQVKVCVEEDPSTIIIDAGNMGLTVVFPGSVELAQLERHRLIRGGVVSPSDGMLQMEPIGMEKYRIRVFQECCEDSYRQLARFTVSLLNKLAPVWAVDDESGKDLSEIASFRPIELFVT